MGANNHSSSRALKHQSSSCGDVPPESRTRWDASPIPLLATPTPVPLCLPYAAFRQLLLYPLAQLDMPSPLTSPVLLSVLGHVVIPALICPALSCLLTLSQYVFFNPNSTLPCHDLYRFLLLPQQYLLYALALSFTSPALCCTDLYCT